MPSGVYVFVLLWQFEICCRYWWVRGYSGDLWSTALCQYLWQFHMSYTD